MSKDFVFVTSGGRTGTKFFGHMLGTVIADCHSMHDPDLIDLREWRESLISLRRFGLWQTFFGKLLGQTGLRVLGQRRLEGMLSDAECLRRLRKARDAYHAAVTESLVVESYGRWWMFGDLIPKAWPGAKIIGIVRDPRDWIESFRRYQPRRHRRGYLGWFPLGALTPRAIGDLDWADRWGELDQFGRLAWDWRTVYGQLERAVDNAPNAQMFRFEDLFGPDDRHVRELVAFAADHGERQYRVRDLTGFTADVRNASKGPRREWPDWPDEQARLLDAMCGPLMRKYGYGLEPEWQAKLERAKTEMQ